MTALALHAIARITAALLRVAFAATCPLLLLEMCDYPLAIARLIHDLDDIARHLARNRRLPVSDTPPAVRPKSAYVNVSVWDLVVGDMRKRDRSGRQKYGCPVQPFNGRNAIRDAYEECLDMAVYLRQEMLQRDLTRAATLEDVARLAEEHGLPSAYVAALRRQAEDLKREIQSVDQMS